jgi:hypothetical protein
MEATQPTGAMKLVGLTLTWGDVTITAQSGEALFQDRELKRFVATGNVLLRRGPDEIRASRLSLSGEALVADGVTLLGPPFRFDAARLHATVGKEYVLEGPTIGASTGELKIRASAVKLTPDGQLNLTEPTIKLWGVRIAKVKRLTLRLSGEGSGQSGPALPLTYRASAISGQILGLRVGFSAAGTSGLADLDQTSKRGVQWGVSLQKTVIRHTTPYDWRRIPFGTDPALPPQAGWLRARPEQLDPLLLNDDLLSQPSPVQPRVWSEAVRADAQVQWQSRRELATRRAGPLLLSRTPEVFAALTYPLGPARQPVTRDAMKTVRWSASLDLVAGKYAEQQLVQKGKRVAATRTGFSAGLASSPLLVAPNVLLGTGFSHTELRYSGGRRFVVGEAAGGLEWKRAPYSGVGVAVIRRSLRGATPLLYDQIDARDEGQLRVRFPVGKNLAGGVLFRRDLTQGKTFDTEFVLGLQGSLFTPGLTYRTLNRQLGLRVTVPAL